MNLDDICRKVTADTDLIVVVEESVPFPDTYEPHTIIFDSQHFDERGDWIPEEYYDYKVRNFKPIDDRKLLVLIYD